MKNLYLYLFVAFAPIGIIAYAFTVLDSKYSVTLLFFYAFIYRAIIDFWRIKAIDKKSKITFWKLLLPFYRFNFLKQLYFKK